MKHFNITVNGAAYDVTVEELAAGAVVGSTLFSIITLPLCALLLSGA